MFLKSNTTSAFTYMAPWPWLELGCFPSQDANPGVTENEINEIIQHIPSNVKVKVESSNTDVKK